MIPYLPRFRVPKAENALETNRGIPSTTLFDTKTWFGKYLKDKRGNSVISALILLTIWFYNFFILIFR